MKKVIAGSFIGCVLFVSGTFAYDIESTKAVPTLYGNSLIETTDAFGTEKIEETKVQKLIKKYELILRNNILETDYEYNQVNYYTSKMEASDIIIPNEIMQEAKKIYFLVEEGSNRLYYAKGLMMDEAESSIDTVKKEYNYKIVEYKKNNKEYVFYNDDLVKDFQNDEYNNVQITLIAEFSDTEKVPLTNTVYISINSKENVLDQLNNQKNKNKSYYGYFNTNDLELYLEKKSESLSRTEYKNMLNNANESIEKSTEKNQKNMDKILDNIKRESDFKEYVDDYAMYSETQKLFKSLGNAVINQLQNIRAFDVIDKILK